MSTSASGVELVLRRAVAFASRQRLFAPGDRVLVYHSNAEPTGVAGIAEVAGAAKADPTQFDPRSEYHDPKSTREEPRWLMRELRFVERFGRVVTLEELKSCKALHAMAALQKGNRLSVTPVTKAEFDAVLRMAKGMPATPAAASRK